jgi:hypothetical protein
MKRPPIECLFAIEDKYISELMSYWIIHEKPCDLKFRKPHTEGLIAVELTVASDETAEFLKQAMEKIRFKLIIKH